MLYEVITLVEAAIAKAFDRPLDAVKRAGMLTGDIGRTAELAREDRLDTAELTLFHPLKFMLASPAEDAAEILKRLGPTVWVEDKYDGIRCQLHRLGREVRLYRITSYNVCYTKLLRRTDPPRSRAAGCLRSRAARRR